MKPQTHRGPTARLVERHPEASLIVERVILGALVVVLAGMFAYGVHGVVVGDVARCHAQKNATLWPTGIGLALVTLLGFGGGRAVGYLRKTRYGGPLTLQRRKAGPNGFVQAGMTVFFVGAALLLGYETFAVIHANGGPPPITTYVRCAAAYQPWISALVAAIIGFLLGNWIWYPTEDWLWRRH